MGLHLVRVVSHAENKVAKRVELDPSATVTASESLHKETASLISAVLSFVQVTLDAYSASFLKSPNFDGRQSK